jgi:hypothetical protein
MNRWKCNECAGKKMTIIMHDKRIEFICDDCYDVKWIKR